MLAILAAAAMLKRSSDEDPQADSGDPRRRWIYLAVVVGVACLIGSGETLPLLFAMLFVLFLLGERMRPASSAAWALLLSVGTVVLFRIILGVPLPDTAVDRLLGI